MNKINGRTPGEIKKGLKCCSDFDYFVCEDDCNYVKAHPYPRCRAILAKDALALIRQLERERDAAVNDMTELMQLGMFCCYCKHLTDGGECTKDYNGIDIKNLGKPGGWWCWQWRGVQEVE